MPTLRNQNKVPGSTIQNEKYGLFPQFYMHISGVIIENYEKAHQFIISIKNDMKKQYAFLNFKAIVTLLFVTIINQFVFGQDSSGSAGSSTTTRTHTSTTTSSDWYTSPWVWVIAAAVIILIIVALSSGRRDSGRSDKVTVTKTVRRDTDV